MDRLASCYFCGVAVDAPLEEYPVVPRDLRPSVENQQTVVLCPQCRRKLSTIVDSVVAATSDPDQTTLSASDSDTSTVESADTGESVEGTMEAGESTEDRQADGSLIEGFGHDDEPSLIDVERPSEDDPTVADDVDAAGESAGSKREPEDTENAEPSKTDATDPAADVNVHGDDTESDTADPASKETSDREFSKSAYNRIVRLLQNREFPLGVEEITTIADSAYEIERRETDAVIDALVDRGVIERDDEQLFRPDGGDD